jgi:Tfp pilus assembly protein PilF
MGLFGNFGKNPPQKKIEPSITPEDKQWVESCYSFLVKFFGLPTPNASTFLFNSTYFPITFSEKKIEVSHLLDDLCNLYKLDRNTISFELLPDVRDIAQTPFEITGKAFESDIEIKNSHYTIYIANNVTQNEHLLLRRLILELTEIKIASSLPDFVEEKNLTYFDYVASIYFGFGVLLSTALVEVGVRYQAGWQRTWRNKSEVPYQIISYALAVYTKLLKSEKPEWENELPPDVKEEYELAINYIRNIPQDEFLKLNSNENIMESKMHHDKALRMSKKGEYEEAEKEFKLAISLTNDRDIINGINSNMAYMYLTIEEYEKSASIYDKVLQLDPLNPYGLNNMGFICLMTGKPERAKEYLEKVVPGNNTLNAFLLRNWGIYYLKVDNTVLSEEYFQKALATQISAPLLEYFYAECLLLLSDKDEALKYAVLSANKGEKKGIELKNKLSP